ncbi:hypothetical protein PR048_028914 [Dryococelus australis]|uniref:Uncharacterized protein n=1 Tax=Dryococelus australis TaxID=614101 RepID=A0ABQ9GBW4_9NEOP|nr:hypothetical protein PR048_028914 [Dryococelus australis]
MGLKYERFQKVAKALISEKQPLAPFVHCGAHGVNFVTMECCKASKTVKRSHKVGKLFSNTIEEKSTFAHIIDQSSDLDAPVKNIGVKIKPLGCTCWIYRKSQIDEIVVI